MSSITIDIDMERFRNVAYVFDHTNPNWVKDKGSNLMFLRAVEKNANELLRSRGHVLLNDVLDMLGMVRTLEGAVSGWALEFSYIHIEFMLVSHDMYEQINVYFNVEGIILEQIASAHTMAVAHHRMATKGDQE